MKPYKVKIDEAAFADIEEITNWYNQRVNGLGTRFQKNLKAQVNSLSYKAQVYSIRYNDIRCMLTKKFPFLIHYSIDEENRIVKIFAVIHTSRNPKIWEQKTKKI